MPADEGDGEGDELHEDDESDACWPLPQRPEGSRNNTGGGSAEVIASDVDTGCGYAGARGRGDSQMALRCGLRDEDSAGECGQADNHDGKRMHQGEKDSADGAGDSAADSRAQANARDEISGERSDEETDQIDEKERTEGRDGERERWSAEVEGDPGEDAHEREEDIEADSEGGDETPEPKHRLHLMREGRQHRG